MRPLADRVLALLAAVALLPLAAATALVVALAMGRPLLFRQQRAGLGGRPFRLLKFRTMHPPRAGRHPLADDAARTSRAGAILRRTRLDELPQLLNVIRGDMAIVGPRPLLPETIAELGERGVRRGSVRPGLTGWAQTHGGPRLGEADKIALDLWYIDHRSLSLDLRILFLTLSVILFGDRPDRAAVDIAHARPADRRG